MAQDQEFYVGQKAFISRPGGEVLVLLLKDNKVDLPGGKLQVGEEDLTAALQREVKEETGLTVTVKEPFYSWHFQFHEKHSQAGKKVFLVAYMCEYVSGEVKISSEHTGYKWVNKENYKEIDDGSKHFLALDYYFKY